MNIYFIYKHLKSYAFALSLSIIGGSDAFSSVPSMNEGSIGLLNCPKEIIKYIGELSGNTLSLKETCKTIKDTEFKTQRESLVRHNSSAFQSLVLAVQAGHIQEGESLQNLFSSDDTICLNMYPLRVQDYIALRLSFETENDERVIIDRVSNFVCMINHGRVRPIKQLIVRTNFSPIALQWGFNNAVDPDTESPVDADSIKVLEDLGIKVRFIRSTNYAIIDRALTQLDLSEAEFYRLMCMTNGIKNTDKLFKDNLCFLGDFLVSNNNFENGELPIRYLRVSDDTEKIVATPIATRAHLGSALTTYSALTQKNQDYSCLFFSDSDLKVMRDQDQKAVVELLLALSGEPEALKTIELIIKLRLTWGKYFFVKYGFRKDGMFLFEYKIWLNNLLAISHEDTEKMVALIRQFIPDFVETDYFFSEDSQERLLNLSITSNIYGKVEKGIDESDFDYFSRHIVFKGFFTGLARFSKETQLLRLKKLLHILKLENFSGYLIHKYANKALCFGDFASYDYPLTRALGFLHDLTPELTPHSFLSIAEHVRGVFPQFNPLMDTAEREFSEAIESLKRQ